MQFRFYLGLLVIGSMVVPGRAQHAASSLGLIGAVQDTSEAVIVGAQVALNTQYGKIVTQAITDSSGNFRFPNVSAGSYTVDVTQTGFQEVKHPPRSLRG
jgi:hypothetical protein